MKTSWMRLWLVLLWLCGSGAAVLAQGPPPLPEVGFHLNSWRFDDATNWWTVRGTAAMAVSGVEAVPTWETNAARLAGTNQAYLQYHWLDTNGLTNLSVGRGCLVLWYRPLLWSGTNAGGTGPGHSARLVELGEFTTNASVGWWSLHITPDGSKVVFASQDTNGGGVWLEAEAQFESNRWTFLALNYTHTNSALFTNGVLAAIGSGVSNVPSPSVCSNGIFFGSDGYGDPLSLAQGDLELVRTFDGPMFDSFFAGYHNYTRSKIEEWENGGGDGLMGGEGDGLIVDDGGGGGLGPGSGCTNGIQFVVPPTWQGTNLLLSLCGGETNGVYDLYFITNLNPTRVWSFVGRSEYAGQSGYLVSGLPVPDGFFVVGRTNDVDGDGMSDAWEQLVSHTDTNAPQPAFKVFITEAVGGGMLP